MANKRISLVLDASQRRSFDMSINDNMNSTGSTNSTKWVTFNDAMDDAMEGGKLFPIKRRMSMGNIPYISTSVSSSVSSSGTESVISRDPLDFSQSFGFGEDIKSRNQPEKLWNNLSSSFRFEDEPVRKISAESNVSSGSFSNDDSDKYSVFQRLEKSKGGKGWGKKVLGSSPMGWSDEILGSVSTDEESEVDPRPQSLHIEEEPWHAGASLGRTTWDKSPSRSFVRNFP